MAFQSPFVNTCSGTELEIVSKRFLESPEKQYITCPMESPFVVLPLWADLLTAIYAEMFHTLYGTCFDQCQTEEKGI